MFAFAFAFLTHIVFEAASVSIGTFSSDQPQLATSPLSITTFGFSIASFFGRCSTRGSVVSVLNITFSYFFLFQELLDCDFQAGVACQDVHPLFVLTVKGQCRHCLFGVSCPHFVQTFQNGVLRSINDRWENFVPSCIKALNVVDE